MIVMVKVLTNDDTDDDDDDGDDEGDGTDRDARRR